MVAAGYAPLGRQRVWVREQVWLRAFVGLCEA